jgi:hypothetical protein
LKQHWASIAEGALRVHFIGSEHRRVTFNQRERIEALMLVFVVRVGQEQCRHLIAPCLCDTSCTAATDCTISGTPSRAHGIGEWNDHGLD